MFKTVLSLAVLLTCAVPVWAQQIMTTADQIVYYCAGQAGISTAPGATINREQLHALLWCVESQKHRLKPK